MVRLGEDAPAKDFGAKGSTLSFLARSVPVPAGFCISCEQGPAGSHRLSDAVRDAFRALKGEGYERFIVRSSGLDEDNPGSLHAGRYFSQRDVTDLPGLLRGVEACLTSVDSFAVKDYRESLGLPARGGAMALIIQAQVTEEFAGVIFGESPEPYPEYDHLIELVQGPSSRMLAGEELGSLFGVIDGASGYEFIQLAGEHLDLPQSAAVLRSTVRSAATVEKLLETKQDIEWVWDGSTLHIVQARPLGKPPLKEFNSEYPTIGYEQSSSLPLAREWGLKAAAALLFRDLEIGARNLVVIEPKKPHNELIEALSERRSGPDGTVIRFSHRTDAGLPRRFVSVEHDGPAAIAEDIERSRRSDEWVTLISDYSFVTDSFEAYVNADSLLVEHVPGNWEPTNTLVPDLFLWTKSGFECFRYSGKRIATIDTPSNSESTSQIRRPVKPLSRDIAQDWARRIVRNFGPIRETLSTDLPINVHFVADDSDRWMFLNIRPTIELDVANYGRTMGKRFKENRRFPITDESDLDAWDGTTPVVVNIATDRGELVRIARVARALRARGAQEVYASFGVLSHPAIVMREFGLRIVPLYGGHEHLDLGSVARW